MTAQDAAVEGTSTQEHGPTAGGKRALRLALIVAVLALAVDQGSKALAVAQLTPGERMPLLGDLFGNR